MAGDVGCMWSSLKLSSLHHFFPSRFLSLFWDFPWYLLSNKMPYTKCKNFHRSLQVNCISDTPMKYAQATCLLQAPGYCHAWYASTRHTLEVHVCQELWPTQFWHSTSWKRRKATFGYKPPTGFREVFKICNSAIRK